MPKPIEHKVVHVENVSDMEACATQMGQEGWTLSVILDNRVSKVLVFARPGQTAKAARAPNYVGLTIDSIQIEIAGVSMFLSDLYHTVCVFNGLGKGKIPDHARQLISEANTKLLEAKKYLEHKFGKPDV